MERVFTAGLNRCKVARFFSWICREMRGWWGRIEGEQYKNAGLPSPDGRYLVI